MTAPPWLAATTGQLPTAAQLDALLITHAMTLVYVGASLGGFTTLGSGSVNTDGEYVAQSFTPGSAETPGRFTFSMSTTGSPGPLTVSIQTSSGSAPSGTAVVTTVIPSQWVPATQTVVSIPLPCSLAGSTVYWAVFNAVGDASDYYNLFKSNQTSGVSTSPTGVTWTAQTYGLYYQAFDQSVVLPLLHTWEDSNARITEFTTSGGLVTGLEEYTVGQGTSQYLYSGRTVAYSGASMTSIS